MPSEPSVPTAVRVVDPFELADRGASYAASLRAADFVRLREIGGVTDNVVVTLAFRRDDEGRCRVDGQVAFTAVVECQRCLERIDVPLTTDVSLCVVTSDAEASRLGEALDTHLLDDGRTTSIAALIEDDAMLALPTRACADDACPRKPAVSFPAAEEEMQELEKPFAVLASLKGRTGTGSE